eukprot:gnl/Spiro4/14119_TR7583_c0_g1_i1.p9 gnl/Spiro4/14119_TR7583_c0_g1~~gnl/Spiro4/14119_TR7583_c0_g1_i1.p9  ORF type:complete len:186 (-),score=24.57 gnl/Spiro4/14119_TR7583_c0_g1_i1:2112-2669(-)
MNVSAAVQDKAKEIFKLLAQDRPFLQALHDVTMEELAKDKPDLSEVTAGILQTSTRTVTISSELVNQLLDDMSVDELQPQLDYIFKVCAESTGQEPFEGIDAELSELIWAHASFSKRLSSELTEKYGPKALEKALEKAKALEGFVEGLKGIPGFNAMAEQAAKESDAVAEEMSPIVAQGMAGEII